MGGTRVDYLGIFLTLFIFAVSTQAHPLMERLVTTQRWLVRGCGVMIRVAGFLWGGRKMFQN